MARKQKNPLGLSRESYLELVQEIYAECGENREKALKLLDKFIKSADDITDFAMVGKLLNDFLKTVDSSIEKKLMLAKLQATLIFGKGGAGQEQAELSEEDRKAMHDFHRNARVGRNSGDDEQKYMM